MAEFKRQKFWTEVRKDVSANTSGKPFSVKSLIYLLVFSPEFHLLFSYRLQSRLINLTVIGKVAAKILWYISRVITGCDVDPRTKIEGGIKIPHAVGIVLSRYATIQSDCVIYQNVTVGADGDKAPFVESGVSIFPGAMVVGGVTIGRNSQIRANALVIESLDADSIVVTPLGRVLDKG